MDCAHRPEMVDEHALDPASFDDEDESAGLRPQAHLAGQPRAVLIVCRRLFLHLRDPGIRTRTKRIGDHHPMRKP